MSILCAVARITAERSGVHDTCFNAMHCFVALGEKGREIAQFFIYFPLIKIALPGNGVEFQLNWFLLGRFI